MSGSRRGHQVPTSRVITRSSRDDTPCAPDARAIGHEAALRNLDASLTYATWPELYDQALRTVRRSYPSACAVLLEVDAERLTSRQPDGVFSSMASRRLAERVGAAPLNIDGEDLAVIEQGEDDLGNDPLRGTLERRLQLNGPAIGRLRLDGVVVALIVLDRSPRPTTTADRHFIAQVAEHISRRIDDVLDAFLASLPR